MGAVIGRISMGSLRLHMNFFQQSFKLTEKSRDGARVKKRYHVPATPYQRLMVHMRTSEQVRLRVQGENHGVYPDGQVRTLQRRLKGWRQAMAHELVFGVATTPTVPALNVPPDMAR